MLDRSNPTPLWAQLELELRERLLAGEFVETFPTESGLTSSYQVSRATVRQAVASLERAGLVERLRGVGTRVAERPLIDTISGMYSMASWIAEAGLAERSVVPICELRTLPDEVAAELELGSGTRGVHVMRIRHAGDEPLAIDRSWLPESFGMALLDCDLTRGSIYDRLSEIAGIRPSASTEEIRPANPDHDDRTILDLPPEELAFQIDRTVRANQSIMEKRTSLIRGDRFVLTASWGATAVER